MRKCGVLVMGSVLGCLAAAGQAAPTTSTLLSDDFSSGLQSRYTVVTDQGGSVEIVDGALKIGLGDGGDRAYLSTRDDMSAQYLLTNTATMHLSADVDFTDLVFTPWPNLATNERQIETVGIFRLMPLIRERLLPDGPVAYVTFGYSDYNRQYYAALGQRIEYANSSSQTAAIPVATFDADRQLHFDLTTTITLVNALQKQWTISSVLDISQNGVSIANLTATSTGAAADSDTTYNPLQHDNIFALGNYLHNRGNDFIELSGSYSFTQVDFTLTYDNDYQYVPPPVGDGPGSGGSSGGNAPDVPEPVTAGWLVLTGLLLRRSRKRAPARTPAHRRPGAARPTGMALAIVAAACGATHWAAQPVAAEDILNFKTAYNARFRAGFGADPIVVPPIRNDSPLFLLAGQDLSGIGWQSDFTNLNIAMISPLHFAQAGHLKARSGLTFFGEDDQLREVANKDAGVNLLGDASVGSLLTPLPNSHQIGYFPIIDRGDRLSDYQGMDVYIYGPPAIVGLAKFTAAYQMWGNHSTGMWDNSWSFGTIGVRGGDSSSPSFAMHDGQVALIGTRSGTWGDATYSGGVDAAWFNGYTIARANQQLAPAGYAVKVLSVPSKHWSATTASSGIFGAAANWAEAVAPGKEAVSFDGSIADCRFDVQFNATPMLRGITFERAAAPQGFVFSGSAVQIGTGGIVNHNARTQTFNNDMSMYYVIDFDTANPSMVSAAQHWSANGGNLVFNGAVANNGFQLVIDGEKDATVNGVLSGSGGLGKEGTGKLILANANAYTGKTTVSNGTLAVNNATGSGTGSGMVNVWGGRIQGNGTIAGALLFNAIGDPTTLAAGNADLGQRGVLTLLQGVELSHETTAEFHLDGLHAGSEYDQLVIQGGDVNLGNAMLSVSVDPALPVDSVFWVINNTGSGSLLNEFAGLPHGATLADGRLAIYYHADFASGMLSGGNDVALVVVPEPGALGLIGMGLWGLVRRREPLR